LQWVSCSVRVDCTAVRTTSPAVATAATTATGRQRADRARPVGNTSRVNTTMRVSIGYHHHDAYQAAKAAPGSEPGLGGEGWWACSIASQPVADSKPTAEKIQPT